MSTRATIKIIERVDNERTGVIYLYHHSDGYPDGIGAELKQWLSKHNDSVWKDEDIIWDIDSIANNLVHGAIKRKDYDTWELRSDLSYQVTFGQHGDEDYGYLIDCDSLTLKCYDLSPDQFEWKEEDLVEIPDKPYWDIPEPKHIYKMTLEEIKAEISKDTWQWIMSFRSVDKLNAELNNATDSLNIQKLHCELTPKMAYYLDMKIELMRRRLMKMKESYKNKKKI